MEARMSKRPREESPDDAPPRVKGWPFLDGLLGQRIEGRFSLGALILGVLACGLCYAIAYADPQGAAASNAAFYALLALGMCGAFWAVRASRKRQPWLGSALVVLALAAIGFAGGAVHTFATFFMGEDGYPARYSEVRDALNAYAEKNGAYPARLEQLMPEYLPHGRLDGFSSMMAYKPGPAPVRDAELVLEMSRFYWHIRATEALPTLGTRMPPLPPPAPATAAPAEAAE